jgi:hypothetical protein
MTMNIKGLLNVRIAPQADVSRKVLVSLGIGAVAYVVTTLVTDAAQGPQIWGLTLSVFIAGVTLVTQMLAELEKRLAKVEDGQQRLARDVKERVDAGFQKVNRASELFGRVDASALPTDEVIQLVRHSTRLHPAVPPLITRFTQAELGRVSAFLKELSDGDNVHYEGEDRDWMLALTRSVELSIHATSLTTVDAGGSSFVDGGLWASDLGQRYLDAQREAIARGIEICRVFILDKAGLASEPEFLEVCDLQREMGVEVRVLDAVTVPSRHKTSLFDFILFDDVVSYEVTPAARIEGGHATTLTTRLELRPARVKDRSLRFAELWASARQFDPTEIPGD